MPSDLEHLTTARSNYIAQLAQLSDPAALKLTYSIGGRSVSWTEYQRFLLDAIGTLDERLASESAGGLADVISVIS